MPNAVDRAVDARIDAFRPVDPPPFDVLLARRRRRNRRTLTSAVAVVAAGLIGGALLLAGQDARNQDKVRLATEPSPGPSTTSHAASRPQAVTFALVSADGLRITVNAIGGGCTRDAHLTAVQTTAEVSLRLLADDTSGPGVVCTTDLHVWPRSMVLDSPLAQRRLSDVASGALVPYFDGQQLASVSWLPSGSEGPTDRPEGRGWTRVYEFPGQQAAAPLAIIQTPGDLLGTDRFQVSGALEASSTRVHGHEAILIVQRDLQGNLLQSRLGWVESGFTFEIDSMPDWVYQRPLQPDVLQHIADGVQPRS
ncbi:MAG: hypothetical protein JWP14_889 [Frankiales bacterium]|nr:hypothetical protein [Frankiales bacterium]